MAYSSSWSLEFTGGAELAEVEYRIRSRKEGADNYVVHEVPKGSELFEVTDLQAGTTYNFSILAQTAKGASGYSSDIVQYSTKAAPPVPAGEGGGGGEEGGDKDTGGGGADGGELLGGVGGAAALLLLCNLGLLACYLRRRRGEEDEESSPGSGSSILEMYLNTVSSSYGEGEGSQDGSSEEYSEEEEEEEREGGHRRRRGGGREEETWVAATHHAPPSSYAPSLPATIYRGRLAPPSLPGYNRSWQQPALHPALRAPQHWPPY